MVSRINISQDKVGVSGDCLSGMPACGQVHFIFPPTEVFHHSITVEQKSSSIDFNGHVSVSKIFYLQI